MLDATVFVPVCVCIPAGCKDTNAACAAWGAATCGLQGVAATCPCMCNKGACVRASARA